MEIEVLTDRLEGIRRHLDRLPETREPPPTTLQLLGQARREGDWQRYLAYFLTPDAPHGLGHSAVETFLRGLEERADLDFTFSQFDLDVVAVATEVPIPDGRLDLVVWAEEAWFVILELKIDSSEGEAQTHRYARAESFQNVGLDPTSVPDGRRHHLYVSPDGTEPASDEFVPIEWSWIVSRLRRVQETDYGSHPARTTEQLDDFIDTIETELTMTEHERNAAAKAGLYVDHYEEIAEVTGAFEAEWAELIGNWGRRLAGTLEGARLVEDSAVPGSVPDEDVLLELPDGEGRRRHWVCRQGNGKWAWFFPTDWWTDLEHDEPTYRNEGWNARVGFLHRPADDRETILEDHELTLYLRNAPSGNDDFYPAFADRFNSDEPIADTLPDVTERPGRKSNVLEASYPLDAGCERLL